MMLTSSITVDQVIDAIAAVLQPIDSAIGIVRAQRNRVPMVPNPGIVLTERNQKDLTIPYIKQDGINEVTDLRGGKQINIQVDFYGESAGEYCNIAKLMFGSPYAFSRMPQGIKPLYTDDGIQGPLISGEEQYVDRWTLTLVLQYNPVVQAPQQSAIELATNVVIPADIFYN